MIINTSQAQKLDNIKFQPKTTGQNNVSVDSDGFAKQSDIGDNKIFQKPDFSKAPSSDSAEGTQNTAPATITAPVEGENAAPSTSTSFSISGCKDRGFYHKISGEYKGQEVKLVMDKESTYVESDGVLFESNPIYSVKGNFAGVGVDLGITQEDKVANGIQYGVCYHVEGKLGDRDLKVDVEGKTIKGKDGQDPDLTVTSKSQYVESGGILFETDVVDVVTGKGLDGEVNGTINRLNSKDSVTVDGQIPDNTMALLLSLKPFIYISQ